MNQSADFLSPLPLIFVGLQKSKMAAGRPSAMISVLGENLDGIRGGDSTVFHSTVQHSRKLVGCHEFHRNTVNTVSRKKMKRE
jgi:hypothetical protein